MIQINMIKLGKNKNKVYIAWRVMYKQIKKLWWVLAHTYILNILWTMYFWGPSQ